MELKKAKRSAVKIRMSVAAPTGFGKTIAALLIAYGICKDWSKIAVVDTENESASLYSEHTIKKTGFFIGEFNTIPLSPPFTAEKFTQAIKVCENAGMEVIILDSITHVWSGEGGLLDDNNKLGGSFQSWAKTTPRYQKWLNSILHSSCHVITTNRKKQGYNIITEGNKTKVEKVGMEDEIRNGYDYEMTVAFDIMNKEHLCFASKDRTGLFDGIPEFVITEETGTIIKNWCESGAQPAPVDYAAKLEACTTLDELKNAFFAIPKDKQTEFVTIKDAVKERISPATPPTTLPSPPAARYKKLIELMKAEGSNVTELLTLARKEFTFTKEQETEFNTIIAGKATAKKEAA